MSSSRMIEVVVCVMFLCMMVSNAAPAQKSTVSCTQVTNSMNPCVYYVVGGGGIVPTDCCNSVRGIWKMARTTTDRQGICTCLQSALGTVSLPPYYLGLIAGLPAACSVNIPYKISPSTNCKTLK